MHPYLAVPAAACVVCASCAGCILARDPSQRAAWLAALLLLGAAFCAMCEVVWNLTGDAESALWWVRLSAAGWIFVGPVVLDLFLHTSEEPWPRLRRLVPALYLGSCAFLALSWLSPWMIRGSVRESWGWGYEVGAAFPVFYAHTMVGVFSGLVVVGRTFQRSYSPAERRLRPWILVGIGAPLGVSAVTDVALPLLGIQVPRLGMTSFALLGGIAVWNVFRFGYSFLTPSTFANEILATLPDGVALLHRDERIRSANEGLTRLSGHAHGRLVGKPIRELLGRRFGESPDEIHEVDCELECATGERIPVSISSSRLRDPQGYAIGLVLVVRDLREVADLRNRLVTSARLAAVGELAAGIAHEINNPIAFVRANLSQLQSHWKTLRSELEHAHRGDATLREVLGEGEELVEESIEGVDRAAEIVRGVKGFSHAGSGEREWADLNRLIEDVLHMAVTQLRGRTTVERNYSDIPEVRCVPQELKQVFLNLVVNASQAIGEAGTIRIATHASRDGVVVRVEDDGPGMPPEIIERIFDPFFTTKRVGEGTGLGLGIAYQIVRRHDGQIRVDSESGRGTCFSVHLPVAMRE